MEGYQTPIPEFTPEDLGLDEDKNIYLIKHSKIWDLCKKYKIPANINTVIGRVKRDNKDDEKRFLLDCLDELLKDVRRFGDPEEYGEYASLISIKWSFKRADRVYHHPSIRNDRSMKIVFYFFVRLYDGILKTRGRKIPKADDEVLAEKALAALYVNGKWDLSQIQHYFYFSGIYDHTSEVVDLVEWYKKKPFLKDIKGAEECFKDLDELVHLIDQVKTDNYAAAEEMETVLNIIADIDRGIDKMYYFVNKDTTTEFLDKSTYKLYKKVNAFLMRIGVEHKR